MKKLLLIALLAITSLGVSAQPPMQRPLPNQFRDFVDHQQKWERPQIEHKDGKIIITMSEQQFKTMQHRRKQAGMSRRPGLYHPMPLMCSCERKQEFIRKRYKR